jgi:hypothetical protein
MCGVSGDASLSPPALGVGHWAGRWITLDYLAGEMNEEKEKKKKTKRKEKRKKERKGMPLSHIATVARCANESLRVSQR